MDPGTDSTQNRRPNIGEKIVLACIAVVLIGLMLCALAAITSSDLKSYLSGEKLVSVCALNNLGHVSCETQPVHFTVKGKKVLSIMLSKPTPRKSSGEHTHKDQHAIGHGRDYKIANGKSTKPSNNVEVKVTMVMPPHNNGPDEIGHKDSEKRRKHHVPVLNDVLAREAAAAALEPTDLLPKEGERKRTVILEVKKVHVNHMHDSHEPHYPFPPHKLHDPHNQNCPQIDQNEHLASVNDHHHEMNAKKLHFVKKVEDGHQGERKSVREGEREYEHRAD